MKRLALFGILSLLSLPLDARLEVEGKSLTKNWALEMIGGDLVKAQMKLMPGINQVPFSIFDTGFEAQYLRLNQPIDIPLAFNGNRRVTGHHGTSVAYVINGDSPYGVSDIVNYVALKRVDPSIFYFSAVKNILSTNPRPWIISNSVGWTNPEIQRLAHDIDQAGIIWVLASGNSHPEPMAEHEALAPVTLVGSVSPYGLESLSSQTAPTLKLLAPSDDYLVSIDGKGQETLFGGTSGAAPIVAATMANLKAVRPTLTRDQLETLLYETGFKMPHSILGRHQSRLINAYAAFHWLLTLNQRCGEDQSCFEQALKIPIQLSVDHDLEKARSYCQNLGDDFSEEDLKNLRRAFLLNRDQETAQLLRCVYLRLNYDLNAMMIEHLMLVHLDPNQLLSRIQQINEQAILAGWWKNPALREDEYFSEESILSLKEIIHTDLGIGRYRAQKILLRLGESIDKTSSRDSE